MTNKDPQSTTDQILDLLLDALVERQKARRRQATPAPPPPQQKPEAKVAPVAPVPAPRPDPRPADERTKSQPAKAAPVPQLKPGPAPQPKPAPAPWAARAQPPAKPQPGDEGWQPPPEQPSINMGKMIGRLAILTVILIVLVNIPVNRYGVSLARILPETSSLIIRDGLILKGDGPEIYRLEDDKLRWISSLDAFEHLGLTWEDVHVVEDEFLDSFETGAAIHVLLKCGTSPHIYRLENGEKRWIQDIDTFEAEGHVWDDVRFVSCSYLKDLPNGPPIPEDAGPPPEP